MAQAKFDMKNEATRQFYAGVGVTDRAVELVRDYVADMQKRLVELQKSIADLDLEPEHLRKQATTRFEALNKDAIARRKAVEKRVAELQDEALALPSKMQKLMDENLATVTKAMDDFAKRGETLVGRIRRQPSTQETLKEAKVTVTKAKTTRTQAATATKSAATKTRETAKKAVATPRSSAKATATAARKTATSAAHAVVEAVEKVGD